LVGIFGKLSNLGETTRVGDPSVSIFHGLYELMHETSLGIKNTNSYIMHASFLDWSRYQLT